MTIITLYPVVSGTCSKKISSREANLIATATVSFGRRVNYQKWDIYGLTNDGRQPLGHDTIFQRAALTETMR